MRIDSHMHLNGAGIDWGWDHNDRVIEAADKLEIDQLICSIPWLAGMPTMDEVRVCNDAVLDMMRRYPTRILGYCYLCPGYQETLDELARCLDQGMVGIKLYYQYKIWDPTVRPTIERAIELGIPILDHAAYLTRERDRQGQPLTSNAADFVRVAREYPEAMLIEAHIGGGGDWEWTVKTLKEAPSVYLDTSGSVVDTGMIEMAARELGCERLLFGTDMSMEAGVGKMLGARLSAAEKELIWSGNMLRILGQRKGGAAC